MATRLYFATVELAGVSPPFAPGWGATSQAVRRRLRRTKLSDSVADGATITIGPAGDATALDRQYVSDPLQQQQVISGTVKGQLMVRELGAAQNIDSVALVVKVVTNSGAVWIANLVGDATVNGSLADLGPRTEYLETGFRNKTFADGDALTQTNLTIVDPGTRIVVEVGHRVASGGGTSPQATARYGDSPFADLPENETQTADGVGWIEFSQDLLWLPDPTVLASDHLARKDIVTFRYPP